MSVIGMPETIKKAKKRHRCSWCGEFIEIGDSYERWIWNDGGAILAVKAHPECEDAMVGGDEFTPYDNPRGCNCGFDARCERCKAKKGE